MHPRLGHVPPSRSGSIMATLSPASRVATVTPIPALPPPRITTSNLRVGMPRSPPKLTAREWHTATSGTIGKAIRFRSGSLDRDLHRLQFVYPAFTTAQAVEIPRASREVSCAFL